MDEPKAAPPVVRRRPRRCILHVGMHKTGTTSIQTTLQDWDDGRTRYARFHVPNHSMPLFAVFGPKDSILPSLERDGRDPAEARRLRRKWRAAFEADMADTSRDLVLSGERLSRPVEEDETVERLMGSLLAHFDRIEVLAYVRRPDEFIAGSLQGAIKHGAACEDMQPFWPWYRKRLGKWAAGRDRVSAQFVLFDRSRLASGCVVHDAMQRMGLDSTGMTVRDRNLSLSAEAATALVCYKRFGPGFADAPGRLGVQSRVASALQRLGNRRIVMSDAARAAVAEACAEDFAWVADLLGLQGSDRAEMMDGGRAAQSPGGFAITTPDDLLSLAPEVEERMRHLVPSHAVTGGSPEDRIAAGVAALFRREWRKRDERKERAEPAA